MCIVFGFLGSVLPNVWTEYSSCRSKHNVGACVETAQCVPSLFIYDTFDCFAHKIVSDRPVQVVQKAFANLLNIINRECLALDLDRSKIMHLAS